MMEHNHCYHKRFLNYLQESRISPLFFCGDSLEVLREIPDNEMDPEFRTGS